MWDDHDGIMQEFSEMTSYQWNTRIWKLVVILLSFFFRQPLNGLVGRVFANGPGDLGSIPVRVTPKTLKMVLDTSLLNTQQYKVRIEGKVEQTKERSNAHPYTSM